MFRLRKIYDTKKSHGEGINSTLIFGTRKIKLWMRKALLNTAWARLPYEGTIME